MVRNGRVSEEWTGERASEEHELTDLINSNVATMKGIMVALAARAVKQRWHGWQRWKAGNSRLLKAIHIIRTSVLLRHSGRWASAMTNYGFRDC